MTTATSITPRSLPCRTSAALERRVPHALLGAYGGDFGEMVGQCGGIVDERHDEVVGTNVVKIARMDENSMPLQQSRCGFFFIVENRDREVKTSSRRHERNALEAIECGGAAL